MNELDEVRLIKVFGKLKAGTRGVIVMCYDDNNFEVEFYDDEGAKIGTYVVSGTYLERVK